MIGIYDYTVILTYCGLFSTLFGIYQASQNNVQNAILCLGITLFCDAFDGRVARTKKNRSDIEKLFGIQIDSLCDLISFGIFPSVLAHYMALNQGIDFIILAYYCLCCVIRLAYFNVLEITKKEGEGSGFVGLPSPSLAVILPLLCLVRLYVGSNIFIWILRGCYILAGTLYISNFKLPKPKVWQIAILSLIFWIPFFMLCF